jgi:excisionase family DNA binding protein
MEKGMASDQPRISFMELLQHDRYTPQELARLLGMNVETIYTAAFKNSLHAHIVGHDVIDISREDVLVWLASEAG